MASRLGLAAASTACIVCTKLCASAWCLWADRKKLWQDKTYDLKASIGVWFDFLSASLWRYYALATAFGLCSSIPTLHWNIGRKSAITRQGFIASIVRVFYFWLQILSIVFGVAYEFRHGFSFEANAGTGHRSQVSGVVTTQSRGHKGIWLAFLDHMSVFVCMSVCCKRLNRRKVPAIGRVHGNSQFCRSGSKMICVQY